MIAFRNVHNLHYLLDRHALVRIYRECRIFLALKKFHQFILHFLQVYWLLVAVYVVAVAVVAETLTVALALT